MSQIHDEELKKFLLHEDPLVRETVAFYFHEFWSTDESLISIVLESFRRFGDESARVVLGLARRFPIAGPSLIECVMELGRSKPPFVEDWLACAPLDLVESHADLLASVVSFKTRTRLERRRTLSATPVDELWRRLTFVTRRVETSGFEREDWEHVDDLVEAVAARASAQFILDRLERLEKVDTIESVMQHDALIRITGAMRLDEATTSLTDLLEDPNDDLAGAAADALGRMRSRTSVETIRARYPRAPWSFRLYAIVALQAMKLPSSEGLLRELERIEDEPALRGRIFDALRFHFTDEAAALIRAELREPASWMLADELEKARYVHSRILGGEDHDALRFRETLERSGDVSIFFHIPVMERLTFDEPCPCASGKIFGTCCGC